MDDSDIERTCTAQARSGRFCNRPPIPDAPFPICFKHAGTLLAFMREELNVTLNGLSDEEANYMIRRARGIFAISVALPLMAGWRGAEPPPPIEDIKSFVYYVRVGELIKIGTTRSVPSRMHAYPPGSELLATERGDVELERSRLIQFGDYLAAKREWFHPAPPLMAHIEKLRAERAA